MWKRFTAPVTRARHPRHFSSGVTDKRLVITGGGGGIGNAICERFAKNGNRVLCVDVSEENCEKTKAIHPNIQAFCTDVTRREAAKDAIDFAISEWGGIDILVNNVAKETHQTPYHEYTDEVWTNIMNLNLATYFRFSKHTIRNFLARPQEEREENPLNIVHIGSVHGFQSVPGAGPYPVSKGGILAMTNQMAVEYGPQNIRVNAIIPGPVLTPLVRAFLKEFNSNEEELATRIPIRKVTLPEDVAKGVEYLCSDDGVFVTGSHLTIDGGILKQGQWRFK